MKEGEEEAKHKHNFVGKKRKYIPMQSTNKKYSKNLSILEKGNI